MFEIRSNFNLQSFDAVLIIKKFLQNETKFRGQSSTPPFFTKAAWTGLQNIFKRRTKISDENFQKLALSPMHKKAYEETLLNSN